MAVSTVESKAWVFVSHASSDLQRVREVRNYLEEQGASPLLFHLRALEGPEEFWPLIEREIGARNFFLYCQSVNADNSTWVQRERRAVDSIRRLRPIRVGSINVEQKTLNTDELDRFVADLRAFVCYSWKDRERIKPFITAMRSIGIDVFTGIESVASGQPWSAMIKRKIEEVSGKGWILNFHSHSSAESQSVQDEIQWAKMKGGKLVLVRLDSEPVPNHLLDCSIIDATISIDSAISELSRVLLTV